MSAKADAGKTVWVLQRLNWQRCGRGDAALLVRLPGVTRVQSFPTAKRAEAERRKREEAARAAVNPFACGSAGLHDKTSLDADRLHDWLLDAGVEPPPAAGGKRDWAGWWRQRGPALSETQRAHVWKALDRLRFFEVVERPARPTVYVVVEVGWHYTDQDFTAEPEGGKPQAVFRDRTKAEEYCEDANDIARDAWEEGLEESQEDLDIEDRLRRQDDPFADPPEGRETRLSATGETQLTIADAPFYEVVEVELEGP